MLTTHFYLVPSLGKSGAILLPPLPLPICLYGIDKGQLYILHPLPPPTLNFSMNTELLQQLNYSTVVALAWKERIKAQNLSLANYPAEIRI
jgi:hypothetical protein